ncbi:hypothetical protein BDY24DRAFT_370782 [Mrakia frigida]|uniref:uncharacterized protein n=1 Tax=Mrakia frigida TaxID=29902 RepID=UPI003FCC1A31
MSTSINEPSSIQLAPLAHLPLPLASEDSTVRSSQPSFKNTMAPSSSSSSTSFPPPPSTQAADFDQESSDEVLRPRGGGCCGCFFGCLAGLLCCGFCCFWESTVWEIRFPIGTFALIHRCSLTGERKGSQGGLSKEPNMSENSRPMGLSERYSLARSLLSSQPLPIVLFNLIPPSTSELFTPSTLLPSVQSALASLLPLHPTLFVRYTDIRSSTPGLAFLPFVDVRKVISVEKEGGSIDTMLEAVMERELELEGDGELSPPWRVLLWFPEDVKKDGFWIGFAGHHSLFDGAAALSFTQALVAALSTFIGSSSSTSLTLVVPLPSSPEFPPTLESIHSTSVSFFTLLPIIYNEILLPLLPTFLRPSSGPPAQHSSPTWIGSSSSLASHPRRKNHLTTHLPSSLIQPLLVLCRKNGTSLTSLLNTLLARSIRTNLVDASSNSVEIKSNTAMSLRPPHLAGLVGGTYTGGFPHTFAFPTNNNNNNNDDDDETLLWLPSRSHHTLLRDPSVLSSSLQQWGLLSYLPSPSSSSSSSTNETWSAFFLPKTVPSSFTTSFELSNLGRVDVESHWFPEGWKLGGIVFSQSPQAMGPALVVSVVGSGGGGVTFGWGWEEGVLGGREEGRKGVERVWEGVRGSVERSDLLSALVLSLARFHQRLP